MSPHMRRRVRTRAAAAWQAGRPHQALEILTVAGMADEWPVFMKACLVQARRRYQARMGA